ncbi:MAG: protein kinase [Phycisphaeraceae bacterium]|nr:protein kinase [Phycisphaeraceae bacterium]
MDPAQQYQRVREHFLRIRELPEADWQHEIDALEREDARVATQVRDLLGFDATPLEKDSEDLFERAIERGVGDAASSFASAADDGGLAPGDVVGNYTVAGKIGRGGFGVVYLAEQGGAVRRRVALKVIRHGVQSDLVLNRFKQERQALALMNHPNIARLYEAGTTPIELGARPYFAMEHVQGPTITRYAIDRGLNTDQRLELFIKVCEAVQHAHAKGIIHRDLKPSNILVSTVEEPHEPKVIDFGIAKALDQRLTDETLHTEQGAFIGTLAYMSPEQADGRGIDTRSDVYALGVILYELLTGTPPIDPKELASMSMQAALRRVCDPKHDKPSTRMSSGRHGAGSFGRGSRAEFDLLVMHCLEADPERRYPTPDALAQDIRRYLQGQPLLAKPPSGRYLVSKFIGRHRLPVAFGALLGVILITALFTVYASQKNENQALEREKQALIDAARTRQERDDAVASNDALRTQAERLQRTIVQTEQEIERREAELTGLQSDIDSFRQERDLLEQEKRDIIAQADALRTDADALRTLLQDLEQSFASLQAERDRLNAQKDALDQQTREQTHALRQLEESIGGLESARRIAEAQSERYEKLYRDTERSVGVLTEGNRIPTDALRLIVEELGSQGVLQGEIYEHLARRVFAQGKFEEAVRTQELAYRAILRAQGSDDPRTVESQVRLVDLLQRNGQYEWAAEQLAQARVVLLRSFLPGNPDHPLFDAIDLARVTQYTATGQLALAYELANALVEVLEARHGPSDLTTLAAVRRRALVSRALGSIGAEEQDYRRVLTQRRDPQTREQAEDLIVAQHNLAMIEQRRGDAQAAELNLERALMRARHAWGSDDWRTAMIQANHANALAMLGNFPEAQTRFEAAYEALAGTIGRRDDQTRAVARAIVRMYEHWNAHLGSDRHNGQIRRWQAVLDETGGS